MNPFFRERLHSKISALYQEGFQEFIDHLFLMKYGPAGFQATRKVRDDGLDGVVVSEQKAIAVYGPKQGYRFREARNKTKEDYFKYQNHLEADYPQWSFICNFEIPTEFLLYFNKAFPGRELLGKQNLLAMIEKLPHSDKYRVLDFLNIDKSIIKSSVMEDIVEDLIQMEAAETSLTYDRPLSDFTKKIALNFAE